MTDPVGVELLFLYCDGVLFNPDRVEIFFTLYHGFRPAAFTRGYYCYDPAGVGV